MATHLKFRNKLLAIVCCAILTVLAGCQGPANTVSARGSVNAIDDCAERLHDISGQLLLFSSANGRLPRNLDEFKQFSSSLPPLVCPVSGKPYIYDPNGLAVPGSSMRAVMYDATPCHSGQRWGIVASPPIRGRPPVAGIVLIPQTPATAKAK